MGAAGSPGRTSNSDQTAPAFGFPELLQGLAHDTDDQPDIPAPPSPHQEESTRPLFWMTKPGLPASGSAPAPQCPKPLPAAPLAPADGHLRAAPALAGSTPAAIPAFRSAQRLSSVAGDAPRPAIAAATVESAAVASGPVPEAASLSPAAAAVPADFGQTGMETPLPASISPPEPAAAALSLTPSEPSQAAPAKRIPAPRPDDIVARQSQIPAALKVPAGGSAKAGEPVSAHSFATGPDMAAASDTAQIPRRTLSQSARYEPAQPNSPAPPTTKDPALPGIPARGISSPVDDKASQPGSPFPGTKASATPKSPPSESSAPAAPTAKTPASLQVPPQTSSPSIPEEPARARSAAHLSSKRPPAQLAAPASRVAASRLSQVVPTPEPTSAPSAQVTVPAPLDASSSVNRAQVKTIEPAVPSTEPQDTGANPPAPPAAAPMAGTTMVRPPLPELLPAASASAAIPTAEPRAFNQKPLRSTPAEPRTAAPNQPGAAAPPAAIPISPGTDNSAPLVGTIPEAATSPTPKPAAPITALPPRPAPPLQSAAAPVTATLAMDAPSVRQEPPAALAFAVTLKSLPDVSGQMPSAALPDSLPAKPRQVAEPAQPDTADSAPTAQPNPHSATTGAPKPRGADPEPSPAVRASSSPAEEAFAASHVPAAPVAAAQEVGSTPAAPPAAHVPADPEAPADPREPAALPHPGTSLAAPPPAAHDIKLQLAGEGGPRVEVRLTERGGDVFVAVRTPDSRLSGELRQDLPSLATRLEQVGYRATTWQPAASGERERLTDPQASASGQDFQGQYRQQGREQQRDPEEQKQKAPANAPGPAQQNESGRDFAWLLSSIR